jgi:hypothetical protein
MMIHTNLDRAVLIATARHIAGVRFERLDESGSRTHARKFDVILSGSSGRRAGWGADHEAATWDEWGIFLNAIFALDPDARAAGYYEAREQFRWATGHRFDTLTPADQHRRHRWIVGVPYQQTCACGAIKRWDPPRGARVEPREFLAALASQVADVMPLGRIFPASVGSRYESNGRYARELGIVEIVNEDLR